MRNILVSLLIAAGSYAAHAQPAVTNLQTEHQHEPVAVDVLQPRFSWQLKETAAASYQSAYEVQVDSADFSGSKKPLWTSGRTASAQSLYVTYQGKPLQSGKRYYWRVRVWDKNNKASDWSAWASWSMGLLSASDWKAQWIGPSQNDAVNQPAPLLRTTFALKKEVKEAVAYITSHGFYEANLNGSKVGDALLTPGWTSYNKRLQYQAYNVKPLLKQGANAIGVSLGSGWYRSPLGPERPVPNKYGTDLALLLQIKIIYTDGSTALITSNPNWKGSTGGVRFAEIYDGCTIDTRKDEQGWQQAGFNDSKWQPVKVQAYPKNTLVATYNEPVRVEDTVKAVTLLTTPKGEKVIDFGQNLVGWAKVYVKGKAGDSIRISYAEVLDKAGNFYTENLRAAKSQDIYVLSDNEPHYFEPQFTWHGFRYIRITGIRGNIEPTDFKAVVIYSDMKVTGSFSCSNPQLNQLQHNIQWGQKGNFLDVPTDCPQRDERLGWTGDAQVFSRTASFNMDVHNFFYKWLKDVAADQFPSGSIPFIIPDVFSDAKNNVGGSTGWGDVATIVPWNMYMAYGDEKVLANQYPSMKAWVSFIHKQTKNDLWTTGEHFGDWLFYSVNDDRFGSSAITSKYLIAQCFYARSVEILTNAATVLHKKEDALYYTNLLKKVKTAFMKEYVTPNGLISSDTQTAYTLALMFDMLPVNLRAQAADRLAKNIERYNYHLTTGFLGTPYLCEALTKFGYNDVAFRLLLQDTYPSWLYPIKMGATTIWERWDGIKTDGSFEEASMNSYNHYSYGAIGDWMYRHITGIQADAPGFKQMTIKPILGGNLTWATASYDCPYGHIQSKWKLNNGKFELTVTIPPNTTANVFVPDASGINYKQYTVGGGTYTYSR